MQTDSGIVIASILAAVMVVVIVLVLIFLWKKRRHETSESKGKRVFLSIALNYYMYTCNLRTYENRTVTRYITKS